MRSLKIKFAAAASLLVVAILLINASFTMMVRRSQLRTEITDGVLSFAQLTVAPLCQGYFLYYSSGYYKFREIVSSLLAMNRNIVEMQVLDVNGNVRFDSREMKGEAARTPRDLFALEPDLLERVKRLELSQREVRLAGGPALSVVMPYVEEWGRHRVSVRYVASYAALARLFRTMVLQVLLATLIFVIVGSAMAYLTARQITDPISRLTVAAREIGQGQLDQAVQVGSNDEIGELAQNFNQMTKQLKENMEALADSYDRLSQANMELLELDKLKSDFIANVSHELRTPLTAISGYADYLFLEKLGPLTESQRKGIDVMRRNVRRLTKQIKDLLDFTTIEAGHFTAVLKPFDLRNLLDEALVNHQAEVEKKKLRLAVDMDQECVVMADRERIAQVIDNLIINGIKFTNQGGITITVRRDGGQARVAVSDSGIGIPRELIPKIFERFQQLDGSSTRRFGGVGLGLAIVKSILDLHRSEISVESEPNRGTTFTFRLPLAAPGDRETTVGEAVI
ncbi:MAG TPA: HAMP domain-containing sensor histidine kinase [Candidatus Edwardsbacteria bacterium]|nr:HAMP domain-containing sensor histidine kinase [Candidatus Edwardsbacteria bacterium]